MTEDNIPIKDLLGDQNVIYEFPNSIEGQIVYPDFIDNTGAEVEIVQINAETLSPPLPPPPPKVKRKRTNAEKARARAQKIKALLTLPPPPKDSYIDFCGLKVQVKSLLQNIDIRKQLQPYIEEVVVSDLSDSSDVEEICRKPNVKVPVAKDKRKLAKPKSKKPKATPVPKVRKGTGPFVEVLIPEIPDSSELVDEDIIVNVPVSIEQNAMESTDAMYVLEEQIQLVTDSSDDEPIIEQHNIVQNKLILSTTDNSINKNKINDSIHKSTTDISKNILESEIIILDDKIEECEKRMNNNHTNDLVDSLAIESDDYYYLNMASKTKGSIEESNGLTVENSSKSNHISPSQELRVESESKERKKRRKPKRIPWSRHAIKGIRGTQRMKDKLQLQGKIIKGGVKKNVYNSDQNLNTDSNIVNKRTEMAGPSSVTDTSKKTIVNNTKNINHKSPKKNGLTSIIQEETSFVDSNELKPIIKQEFMPAWNGEIATELSNNENFENKIHIKLEQEVSWNTDVDYQNMYLQKQLNKQRIVSQDQNNFRTSVRQKQSRSNSKLFFGRRRIIFKCSYCGKKYERVSNLRRHEERCKKNYECALCPFFTFDKITFKDHLANHILGNVDTNSGIEQEQFIGSLNYLMAYCSNCNQDCLAVEGLSKCLKCYDHLEYYRCGICDKLFDEYLPLRQHVLLSLQGSHVARLQINTEQCSRCGIGGFSTKCELRKHLATNCGSKTTINLPYVRLERYEILEKLTKDTKMAVHNFMKMTIKTEQSILLEKENAVKNKYKDENPEDFKSQTIVTQPTNMNTTASKNISDILKSVMKLVESKTHNIKLTMSTENSNRIIATERNSIIDKETTSKTNKMLSMSALDKITNTNTMLNKIEKQAPKYKTAFKISCPVKQMDRKQMKIEKQISFVNPKQSSSDGTATGFTQHSNKVKSNFMDNNINFQRKYLNKKIKTSILKAHIEFTQPNNAVTTTQEFNNISSKLSKKTVSGLANKIKRFCLKCDKTKKFYEKMKMGLTKEICRKCRMELVYLCRNCNGISKCYKSMVWHLVYKCKLRLRFSVISHKSHLRKILENRYEIFEAQQKILDSIASQC